MRSLTTVTFCMVLALALTARAGLRIGIGNGDRITGSISPVEVETYVVDLPAGATLSVSLKGKKSADTGKPILDVAIIDAADTVLFTTATSKGNVKAKVVAALTGPHRIVVTSADTGLFQFTAKWKSPKKATIALALGDTPDEQSVPFAADAGATMNCTVKSSKGSEAEPRFDRVDHVSGGETDLPDPADSGKGHKLKKIAIDTFGAQFLYVANDGPGGTVKGSLKIKAPKPPKRRLDLTARFVGDDPGEDGVGGIVTREKGGFIEADDDAPGGIGGSAVDVGPGAVTSPTVLVVTSSVAIEPPSPDKIGAGPTIFFGPEGKVFEIPVTIRIPYDPDVFMGDFTGLEVYTRDANGTVSLVPGPYDLSMAGVVSVMVSHFSSFRVVGPAPPTLPPAKFDLNADGADDLVVPAPNAGTNGEGRVHVFFGPFTADLTSTAADVTITGAVSSGAFGKAVLVGDLDQDGVADLTVGSDSHPAGQVHVFLGGAGFSPTVPGDADYVITGESTGDGFGGALAAGDISGDFAPELLVGAERAAGGKGRVYGFLGSPPLIPFLLPALAGDANGQFTGDVVGDLLGVSIAAGDINGDNKGDLVMGADMIDTVDRPGAIYVLLGPFLGRGPATEAQIIINGDTTLGGFGARVAVGDVTGDDVDDIVVSELTDSPTATPGAVYVFDGDALVPTLPPGGSALALQTRRYLGNDTNDRLGSALGFHDPGGGGALTLLAIAPNHDGLGALYEFPGGVSLPPSGAVGATQASIVGEVGGGLRFFLDPIDTAGTIAISASAPGFGTGAGRVYLFLTSRTSEASASLAEVTIDGAAGEGLGGGSD